MAITDDRTENFDWQIPNLSNKVRDDIPRIRSAFGAIDSQVFQMAQAILEKADADHGHPISAITGLSEALASKAASGHQHAFDDLSDVEVAGAANGMVVTRQAGKWVPYKLQVGDVANLESLIAATAAGVGRRSRVRAAADGNFAPAGLVAGSGINNVTLATGDLVLLKGQTNPAENGIYVVGTGARFSEFDTYEEHVGSLVSVAEGLNADTLWLCTSNAGGTLGTTPLTFVKMVTAGELLAPNNLSDIPDKLAALANLGADVRYARQNVDGQILSRPLIKGMSSSGINLIPDDNQFILTAANSGLSLNGNVLIVGTAGGHYANILWAYPATGQIANIAAGFVGGPSVLASNISSVAGAEDGKLTLSAVAADNSMRIINRTGFAQYVGATILF